MQFLSLGWWYAPLYPYPYPFPLVVVVGLMPPRTLEQPAHEWLLRIHRLQQQVCDLPLTTYRLHRQIFDLPLTLTAYANTLTIYLLRLTLTLNPHAVPPTKGVCVYLSRLPLASTLLGLSSICYLLPLGVSLLVLFCLLGLVLLYPSARLENRIISWYFAHLCRSSPYSCFALRLRAFRRRCGTCLYLCRLERLYWLYLRPLGTFYVQG